MKTLYILLIVFFLMGVLKVLNKNKPEDENKKQFELNKKLKPTLPVFYFNAL